MKTTLNMFVGAFAVIGFVATITTMATPAFAQEKESEDAPKATKWVKPTAPMAKLLPSAAMKIASSKTGGTAKMAMFEFEDGHWIYGVIVAKNHKLMEVELDANTGKVGDTESITPEAEGKEMAGEFAQMAK